MGLFKAAKGAVDSVLADQWKEFISVRTMTNEELQLEGIANVSEHSSNTMRDDNIITDGSIIMLGVGENAIAVENGKVLEIYTKPGENIFHSERSKSIFSGAKAKDLSKDAVERFTYAGGFSPVVQKVFYINMREMMGKDFEIPEGVPVRVVDENTGQDMDCTLIGKGMFSYRIVAPDVFYKKVSGNKSMFSTYDLEPQMKDELLNLLLDEVGKLTTEGVRASRITELIPTICNNVIAGMNKFLVENRGIAICSLAMPSCRLIDGDMNIIKQLQHDAVFKDGFYADNSSLVDNQRKRFLGNMTKNNETQITKNITSSYFKTTTNSEFFNGTKAKPGSWYCDCGKTNTGNFCEECGHPRKDR